MMRRKPAAGKASRGETKRRSVRGDRSARENASQERDYEDTPSRGSSSPTRAGRLTSKNPEPRSSGVSRRTARASSRGSAKESSGGFDIPDNTMEMKTGWGAIEKHREVVKARKERMSKNLSNFFLKDGESAEIQLLDNSGPTVFQSHDTRNKFGRFEKQTCQKMGKQSHCLMCQAGLQPKWTAAIKVLDYRGQWDKKLGDFDGGEPRECIWYLSSTVSSQLNSFLKNKGIEDHTSICIIITRSGEKQNTSYNLELSPEPPYEDYDEKEATTMEVISPLSDDELEDLGFASYE